MGIHLGKGLGKLIHGEFKALGFAAGAIGKGTEKFVKGTHLDDAAKKAGKELRHVAKDVIHDVDRFCDKTGITKAAKKVGNVIEKGVDEAADGLEEGVKKFF